MLLPKKQKYRKSHRLRGKSGGLTKGGASVAFGRFALKATTQCELTSRQIEAARRTIARSVKRGGKIWIRVFPHKAITKKAAEVPMGSGKGSVDHYVMEIHPGRILFEMDGVAPEVAREALRLAAYKLPCQCRIIDREEIN
jgi:large subunit ribosomal protein L16